MAFLIKVTIAWAISLLLFELLYKNNARYTSNRIYLLLSITIGLLLPIIYLPFGPSWNIGIVSDPHTIAQSNQTLAIAATKQSVSPAVMTNEIHGWDFMLIIVIIYCVGVSILLIKYLVELFKIAVLIRKNRVHLVYGHKVINTGKVHSPYSFMSYTFLTATTSYAPEELEYIIRHEAAHNTRKHWLDLWLLQLVNTIFWFHPLIWRYRYLLRLQHEYEADAIAAANDPYNYGRFILQQILLRGVPSITHSFHFSPIKNRIDMLTKINGSKSNNRKYLLLIPVMLGCTFLMANSNSKAEEIQGNKMSFKGKVLTWRQSDTVFYDKEKGKAEIVSANAKIKPLVIVGINDEPVFRNDYLQIQASYGNTSTAFADYVKDEFQKLRENTADSLTYLADLSLVVDKDGEVVYFNAHYARSEKTGGQPIWYSFLNSDVHANDLMEKIIAKSGLWKPALNNGMPVNSYVSVRFPGC